MKKLFLAVIVLALRSLSLAETPSAASANNQQQAAAKLRQNNGAQAAARSQFSSADCAFTFTSGSNATFLKYCVTANGNVTAFETPATHEHIAVLQVGEGYGVCDVDAQVAYFDYAEAGETGNWGPASVVSHTAKSVKIARTTSDGIWTLTQTFSQVAGALPSVRITMALKNNSTVNRSAILLRYVDVDADGVPTNNLDSTVSTAFGWNSLSSPGPAEPFGLVLQNLNPGRFVSVALAQNTFEGPAPCDPVGNAAAATLLSTDASLLVAYAIGVPKSASVTVTVAYKGM